MRGSACWLVPLRDLTAHPPEASPGAPPRYFLAGPPSLDGATYPPNPRHLRPPQNLAAARAQACGPFPAASRFIRSFLVLQPASPSPPLAARASAVSLLNCRHPGCPRLAPPHPLPRTPTGLCTCSCEIIAQHILVRVCRHVCRNALVSLPLPRV